MITSAAEFKTLRESSLEDEYTRAANDEAPLDVWHEILKKHPDLAFWVAQNKTVPIEVLEVLSNNENRDVRDMVARKRKLPEKIMMRLAIDKDEAVRHALVCNSKVTKRVLEILAQDKWESVSNVAKEKLAL